MPIRKKGDVEIQASANGTKVRQTGYTFYSYDKKAAALYFQFREQDGQPTDLGKATVHLVMILNDDNGKEFIPGDTEIEVLSAIRGTAKYVLPEMLLSYEGKVTGYVYMNFDDGSRSDDGQFTFRIKHSMITHVLPELGDKYVRDFEDVKAEVQEAADGAKETISQKVTEVSDTSDSAISKVNQAADDTIKTANQAQDDIQTSVSDVQSKQAGAEKDIAGLVESTESARDEAVKTMNELDYTDRNLIVTSKLSSFNPYSTQPVIKNNGRKITIKYKGHESRLVALKVAGWRPPEGKYTLSGRIEINGEPVTQETFSSKKAHIEHPNSANERFEILSDGSFIVTETYDLETDDHWIIHTRFDGIESGDVITFYDLQFQPGSVATPWQPSFGDYDAKIKKLEEAITSLGGSI